MKKKSVTIIIIELCFLAIMYFSLRYIKIIPSCWVYKKTGFLCPSCGGTRCVVNFLQGNFKEAFNNHIVFFLGILYLIVINIVYLINLNKKQKILEWIYPKYWFAIIFIIILAIYTILRNIL